MTQQHSDQLDQDFVAEEFQANPAGHAHGNAPHAGIPNTFVSPQQIHAAKIVIVDDEPINIMAVKKYLGDSGYSEFYTTTNASEALGLVRNHDPDVILLDYMMPEMNGLQIVHALRSVPALLHIPVLMLTASSDRETRIRAIEAGVTDFLSKPVDPAELVARIRNVLALKLSHDKLSRYSQDLEQQVKARTAELEQSRLDVIQCLARAAEYRDCDTGQHVLRVGRYVALIAKEMGFSDTEAYDMELAAQLHDVGKISIPDEVLLKKDALDPQEMDIIRKHCTAGKRIIKPLSEEHTMTLRRHAQLGASMIKIESSPILDLASSIALTHHECWDGTGYPLGLAGEDIPIEGRITAVADVYDALSSARPYKLPFPREKCLQIMEEKRGTHFDPKVFDAFQNRMDEIVRIQIHFADVG